jgi:hypothetical protein
MRLLQIATLVALAASSSAAVLPRGDIIHRDSLSQSVSLIYHRQNGGSYTHFDDEIRLQARDLGQDPKEHAEDLNERLKNLAKAIHYAADGLLFIAGGIFAPTD